MCTKHSCKLFDRCPKCASPVNPIKNDIGNQKIPYKGSITNCYKCSYDLRKTPSAIAKKNLVKNTTCYEKALHLGYIRLKKKQWIYSFSFFKVLRYMMRLVTLHKNNKKIMNSKLDPDILSSNDRYSALTELIGFHKNWPYQMLSICKKLNISYYEFTSIGKDKNPIPFWLDSEIKTYLYRPNIAPSKESVISAICYMKKNDIKINISSLNKIMGYKDSGVIKELFNSSLLSK